MTEKELKKELENQANTIESQPNEPSETPVLKKSMSIPDMIKLLSPEIKKALPQAISPERFTRIALSALNQTPELRKCEGMSFISALLSSAALGLEVNSPLGESYLIPYKNKGILECSFQIGYRGLISLAYRSGKLISIEAHTVYENDEFHYELGLTPTLKHIPSLETKGEAIGYYSIARLVNNGMCFAFMSKPEMEEYAKFNCRAYGSTYSAWNDHFDAMAKKTVIKQALKYAPLSPEYRTALSVDESISHSLPDNLSDLEPLSIQ